MEKKAEKAEKVRQQQQVKSVGAASSQSESCSDDSDSERCIAVVCVLAAVVMEFTHPLCLCLISFGVLLRNCVLTLLVKPGTQLTQSANF